MVRRSMEPFFCKHDDCEYYIKNGRKNRKILLKHNEFIVECRCPKCLQFSTLVVKEEPKVDILEENKLLLQQLDSLKKRKSDASA